MSNHQVVSGCRASIGYCAAAGNEEVFLTAGGKTRIAEGDATGIEALYDAETGRYYAPYNPIDKKLEALYDLGFTGEGRTTAVLDTGVLYHHPLLTGKIVGSVDFTGEGPEDFNGHGTVVALLAAGPRPKGPSILNVKVLDRWGEGSEEDAVAGMRWARRNGANAINISFGIPRDCDGTCALCSEATRIANETEIVICAAAGNFGPGVRCCPAQCDAVEAIGALDYSGDKVADYSGLGDAYMPGSYQRVEVDDEGRLVVPDDA